MWIRGYSGITRTKVGDDEIIVLRNRGPGEQKGWRIEVNRDRSRFPSVYPTQCEAMKQAELWIQLREMEA